MPATAHPVAPKLAVSVRNLTKRYGTKQAVAGLNLDVEYGETFAILGPNGAGKTTTVEILEGFRNRDGGEVSVLGEDPARAGRAWRTRIGIVLQGTADLAELTVSELIHHIAKYYPNPRDPDELIDTVGLRSQAGVRVRGLSGGQRRRLDVALGIVGNPQLLFLDEPTTGFDPEARRSFWRLLRALKAEGTTILLTTHYLDEAEQLADRVAVVTAGRVIALDEPARLGGRARHEARVRWQEGDVLNEVRTPTPTAVVAELTARLGRDGGEVPALEVLRPTLEDIYLELVNQELQPTAPDAASNHEQLAAEVTGGQGVK